MKKIYALLVSAIVLLSFQNALAQCTAQFTQGTSNSNGNGYNWGNAFTAPCTGTLEYVQLYAATSGTVAAGTLRIFAGKTVSGTPVYTQSYSAFAVTAGSPLRVDLTGVFNVVNQSQYTFVLWVSGVNIYYYPSFSIYPLGGSFQNGGGSYQHNFKISVLSATGTEDIKPTLSASLYPNPSNGKFKVQCEEASMFKCDVIDQLGKNVLSTTIQKDLSDDLDLTSFPKGLYFVRLTNETGSCTKKLMID
jgi:hypothetical protein